MSSSGEGRGSSGPEMTAADARELETPGGAGEIPPDLLDEPESTATAVHGR